MHLFRQLAVVGGGVLALACGGTYGMGPGSNPGTNNPGGNNQSGNGPTVTVDNDFFNPATDTVSVNSTVTWNWVGGVDHNVTFQDGRASSTQASGTYQRSFTAAGTYPYRCTIHSSSFTSGMTGTVVVR